MPLDSTMDEKRLEYLARLRQLAFVAQAAALAGFAFIAITQIYWGSSGAVLKAVLVAADTLALLVAAGATLKIRSLRKSHKEHKGSHT